MPSSATITSIVTMVAGTKARASDYNNNLDNQRGHFLPLNTDTMTSSHQTHDLGATDHNWRRVYLKETPFVNGVQLGKVPIPIMHEGSAPADYFDDIGWSYITGFPKYLTTDMRFGFVVPDEYVATNRISLNVKGYCETGAAAHITLETWSALYRPGTTDASLTSPTNVLTSTSNIAPPTTAAILFSDTTLRISNSGGTINGVTIAAGDLIQVAFRRKGDATADTNSGYFFLESLVVDLNN